MNRAINSLLQLHTLLHAVLTRRWNFWSHLRSTY